MPPVEITSGDVFRIELEDGVLHVRRMEYAPGARRSDSGRGWGKRMLLHTSAVHEAGHAVAACALGVRFDHVALKPIEGAVCPNTGRKNPWNGGYVKIRCFIITYRVFIELPKGSGTFVERTVANSARLRKRHEDFIVMLLAGREAMQLVGASTGSGHRIDYHSARAYARKWLGAATKEECDAIIAKLRVRAARLVKKKSAAIIWIAEALDERGTLTAHEVRQLYDGRLLRCWATMTGR